MLGSLLFASFGKHDCFPICCIPIADILEYFLDCFFFLFVVVEVITTTVAVPFLQLNLLGILHFQSNSERLTNN